MKFTIENGNNIVFLDTKDLIDTETKANIETKLKEVLELLKKNEALDNDVAFYQCAKP
ncbi:hypothetical protein [uncultured Methanomethylovorans sp.]|uniref:hypothetical protein n=1 Tax=uncultured Methanomethylovorans sp. TaxID=183759 RepID=UPI002AA83EDB|nr:hypothetical protein [uncultured Methanomethylovorans sp.]